MICSFTDFPRKGKSSTVISGRNPLDCKLKDDSSLGMVFFSSKWI
uniref:Uncharacterized protein n=1 Tax=Elizabethkingia anophelis TaxID=1117645 RepID=A0A455ZH36_9FLAO|nr:TPA_exp: hypothetical protein [Elizabethkingia anophelis]DAC76155.1 TPA_exp: hypothetical protein [Elizabethkingia anophelis]